MIPEFETKWNAGSLLFGGTFTEYDAESDLLPTDSVISQMATGARFALKYRRLSGVGVVELDLERIKDGKLSERSF